jgi:DNA-binding MarR family transcriptional regulator
MTGNARGGWFELLNEIGIIAQLSRAAFEARMPGGLAQPQFSVLNHFVRLGDGKSPLDLARAFQVPKTTMTHTLAVLEARGLVETRPNPKDGRSKLIYITDAGRALRDAAIARLAAEMGPMLDAADPGLPARALPDLRILRKLLDENRDG